MLVFTMAGGRAEEGDERGEAIVRSMRAGTTIAAAALVAACRPGAPVEQRGPSLPAMVRVAARVDAARVREQLELDPIRRPGDPIVQQLVALRAIGAIDVLECHTRSRETVLDHHPVCVDVSFDRIVVRAMLNDDSRNRATIARETSEPRTVVIVSSPDDTRRGVLMLDARGVVRERIALPGPYTTMLVRSGVLLGGIGWITSGMGTMGGTPFDLALQGAGRHRSFGLGRGSAEGPCVALNRGTLCERSASDREVAFQYFPLGSESKFVVPALDSSMDEPALRTSIRVLMRLRETEDGADLLVGLPLAHEERGAAFVMHLDQRTMTLELKSEIDFSAVSAQRRRFCGSHAEIQEVRYDRQSIAIACANQSLVSVTLRDLAAPRVTLLLGEPLSTTEFRVLPPVGGASDGALYVHWCGDPSPSDMGGEICVSRVRPGWDARVLFRRSIARWSAWSASVGASASGEERLMFATESADQPSVTIESMRVSEDSVVTEWSTKVEGRDVMFLQSAVSI